MKTFLTSIIVICIQSLACAWILMLTVGVIRGEWLHSLPTIGFFSSLLVSSFFIIAYKLYAYYANQLTTLINILTYRYDED